MSLILIVVHIVVCVALIMIVLFQTGKGADLGAAFGGGSSQTLFGSTGASTFLSKATTVAAIVFMLTSLTLAYISGQGGTKSIMDEVKTAAEQPAETAGTPTEPETSPAPVAQAPAAESAAPATQAPAPAPAAPAPAAPAPTAPTEQATK